MKKIVTIVSVLTFASLSVVSAENLLVSAGSLCPQEMTLAQDKPAKEYKEVTFSVHLHCQDCVNKVKENISFEKGVKDLEVSLENQTIRIKYDSKKTDETKLKAAIEKLGYEVHKEEK